MDNKIYEKFKIISTEFDQAQQAYNVKLHEMNKVLGDITLLDIESSLLRFYKELEKLNYVLVRSLNSFSSEKKVANKNFKDYLRSKKIKIKEHKYLVPAKHLEQFELLYNSCKNIDDYIFTAYKSYIVNGTSLFDTFISTTITNLKSIKRDLFYNNLKKSKDKLFSYTDIFDGNFTLTDYEQKYVTKHLVSDNRVKQIKWLLSLLGVNVQETFIDQEVTSKFIEFTEVRNLLVHNQGKVNKQFINNLKNNQIDASKYKLHGTIILNEKDILQFKNVLIRIISMLNNYICSYIEKLCDREINNEIDELSLLLIKNEDYRLCENIINDYMGYKDKTISLEDVLKINLGQIYKIKKYNKKLRDLCKTISNQKERYILCKAILLDDSNVIYEKTKTITMPKTNFYIWPIFRFVKNNKLFLKAFSERYKESYNEEMIEKDD